MSLKSPPTALVTGASRGLGRALALTLAGAGTRVIAMARPSAELRETEARVQQLQPSSYALGCDLSDSGAIDRACAEILSRSPALDALVHNAAIIGPVVPTQRLSPGGFAEVIQVNLCAVHALTLGLLPALEGPRWSRVTLVSSGAATTAFGSWSAYCASKAALEMWGRCAAQDLAAQKVSVLSVSPGVIDTQMQQTLRAADPSDFPSHDRFVSYHDEGKLMDARVVSERLAPLCMRHPKNLSGQKMILWSQECGDLVEKLLV